MDNQNLDLLEFLQYIIGCTYISDLKCTACRKKVEMLLKHLNLKHWQLNQLKDVINYIFK